MRERTPRFSGSRWAKLRAWVLSREPLCRACDAAGTVRAAEEVDHVVPLFMGGSNSEDNLQPLCKACHLAKSIEELRGAQPTGHSADGAPLNPSHHWNTER
jgi:5-methylcytosine-specific restriction protein A